MFKCVLCSLVFTRKDNLCRHEKIHIGVRFPCTVCIKSFSDKSNLVKHMKNVHGMYIYYLIFFDINIYLIFLFFPKISFRFIFNPLERALFNLRLILLDLLHRFRLRLRFSSPIPRLVVRTWYPTRMTMTCVWKPWIYLNEMLIQVSFIILELIRFILFDVDYLYKDVCR